ncbi:MAG: radical SAM protein, partial [Candidatus Moranbacteria bacterium]|nr:radical SAM protein [Candidatus Moranbacteria bacterium]
MKLPEALLFSPLKSGVCRCDLCSRGCVISAYKGKINGGIPGELRKENVGFCGTRVNLGGKLYAINYGRVTSLAADPVEKKPLYHFFPGEELLSFGSFGCNFRCPNCHNWEISQTSSLIHSRPEALWEIRNSFSEVEPAEIVNQALENDCVGIAYTYNEPTVFLEFALAVMRLARKAKLKNVWVTNGFFSEKARELVLPLLDAVNVDLKSFDQRFYLSHCKGGLAPVLENIEAICNAGIHLEIATLVIPRLNDDPQMLGGLAKFIAGKLSKNTPWHLIDFSAPISWQMQDWESAGKEKIAAAYGIGRAAGLNFV